MTAQSVLNTQLQDDATPAYRGYRLQALFALQLMLSTPPSQDRVFVPEGLEDLAVLDASGRVTHVYQVKARSGDLSISSLEPDKKNSFFYRVAELIQREPAPSVSIVTYGGVGHELQAAVSGEEAPRRRAAAKLTSYGHLSQGTAERVLASLRIIHVDEPDLLRNVSAALRDGLAGVDPNVAFDLLLFWLYVCSERRSAISRAALFERIVQIGRFLAGRAAYHAEWFSSIVPITDETPAGTNIAGLIEEYRQGTSARYEHILANADSPRPEWQQNLRFARIWRKIAGEA